MAVKGTNDRIQVTISKELLAKVKMYSEKIGLSASAFISMATAEKIMQYEKAFEIVDKYAGVALVEALKESEEKKGE